MFPVDIFLVGIADQLSFLWMHMVCLCSVSLDVVWSFLTGGDLHVRMRLSRERLIHFMCAWRKPWI